MERFLTLKQGSSSVKEYVNKFNQLARFGLDLVNTPEKKVLRFVNGLNEPLQGLAMTHIPMGATFEKLVDMALMHEKKGANANKAPEGIRRNHNNKTRRVVKTITARERRNVLTVGHQAISARIAERKRTQAVFIVAMRDI